MSIEWMAALVVIGFLVTLALIEAAIWYCYQCVIAAIIIGGIIAMYGVALWGVAILRDQTERLTNKRNRP